MKANQLAVTTAFPELEDRAQNLAQALSLELIPDQQECPYPYLISLRPDYLSIIKPGEKQFKPFYIDFLAGKLNYRVEQAGLRKEAIAKAMGCHPKENWQILDATAGLGRDSFILASLGFEITMLERSPIIHALLADAIQRAANSPSLKDTIERMHLLHSDAIAWLDKQAYTSRPDVIYIDPMFPERKKSASVKKDMVILQDLLGTDTDRENLFKLALTHAKKRVVVKLPKNADKIGENDANFSITGKSCRFDIYLV